MAAVRFQLLSRPSCHLCDEMEAILASVLPAYGEAYVVEDVDARSEWRQRYGEVIPVLLRDGRPVAKVRIDADRLRQIVEGRRIDQED